MRFSLAATALAVIAAIPAGAQQQQQHHGWVATTWEPVTQSLAELLNGGHRIITAAPPALMLARGGKYIACQLRPPGGLSGATAASASCHRLN